MAVFIILALAGAAISVTGVRRFPAAQWPVVAMGFIAGAELLTHLIFNFSCGPIPENPSQDAIEACDAYPDGLPLIGIPAVIAGGAASWVARTPLPLAAGLALGAGAALFPWIVYGDPAGNWEGLFFSW